MNCMFAGALVFNADISGWDTSGVTDMGNMLSAAWEFNQDISRWDTSNVKDMSTMFDNAIAFDQDISGCDTSSVTDMTGMFWNNKMSTAKYDALLVSWESQAVQENVRFGAGSSEYSAGAPAEARQRLISDHGWTIDDNGEWQ